MWQTWAISGVQILFILSLLPTIFDTQQKPALSTSIITVLGGLVLAYAFYSLSLWSAVVTTTILNLEWAILAYQRYKLDKRV